MKLYQLRDAENLEGDIDAPAECSPEFYAGKTEASKAAREIAAESGKPINVYEVELEPGKAGIVALANGEGFVETLLVYTARPRKRSTQTHGAAAGCHGTDDDIEGLM